MTDTQTPAYLQDAAQLLTESGFTTSNVWYHGTASGLIESIKTHGLKQSGDAESNERAKKTMSTIGGSYKEHKDPIFLTQSKELAFYWALQATKTRNLRFGGNETPVVVEVNLPEKMNDLVKPDVGAAAMLLIGNDYTDKVSEIYQANKLLAPEINPSSADRMDYLNKLGLAYIKKGIPSENLTVLSE